MIQQTTAKPGKPALRTNANILDYGIAGPNCVFVRIKERVKPSASAQERIKKHFFELVGQGNADELNKQISRLEKSGIDIKPIMNARKQANVTLLMLASASGLAQICALLIEKGADVNARDRNDLAALMYAAGCGQTDACIQLIEKGADTKARDRNGLTALDYAEHYDHGGTAAFLESVESKQTGRVSRQRKQSDF
jgi:hypothetical protein